MTTRPVVDAKDLLLTMQEALWLTFLIDLHLLEQRDPELEEAAERLGWIVRELNPIWPRSLADASTTPRVLPTWKRFCREMERMQDRARTIHKSLARMEPEALGSDATTRQEPPSPEWAEAAERNREPLIEVWRLLIEAANSDAICPPRLLTDQQLSEQLKRIREDLIPALSFSADPHRQPHAVLDRRREKLPEPLARHLTRRIARSWKAQGTNRSKKSQQVLKDASERSDRSRREVKEEYVRPNLWAALDAFSQPQRVEMGQEGREALKRKNTPVRTVSTHRVDTEDTRKWAESSLEDRKPSPPARVWPDDLPIYRTWKWVVNKTINEAQANLLRQYDPSHDVAADADSLDASRHRTMTDTDEDRTLHDQVGDLSSGRQYEALIALEELDGEIKRVSQMLDVGSPQQRQIVLARLDPRAKLAEPFLKEDPGLSERERKMLETRCSTWSDVADAVGVKTTGHVKRQYRRCEEKLEDE